MELKRQYFEEHGADLFVMGDDWEGKFDHLLDAVDVKYLLRTANVSSTDIKKTSHNHTEHKIKGDGKLTVTADPTADLRTPKSSADDASQETMQPLQPLQPPRLGTLAPSMQAG